MAHGVVVVGTGQAGFQLAASLREAGFAAPITLVGDEPGLPYQRPPLSKGFLQAKVDDAGLLLRPPAFYERIDVRVRGGTRVLSIDRMARQVALSGGAALPYDHLVLATGAAARTLAVPGADLQGVFVLRGLDDAQRIRARLAQASAVAVVGAGFIGLELAAVVRGMGLAMHVIDTAARPLARALSEPMARHLQAFHEAQGTRFHLSAQLAAIEGAHGHATGLRLREGSPVAADLVVVAVGVTPNDQLARDAGLRVGNGIEVDELLLTSDPAISALGDGASFPFAFGGGARVRIESVQNAVDQARCIAARLCGQPVPYAKVPWFWSEQGPCRLQMAGLAEPSDRSDIEGDPASGRFSVLRYRGDQLSAVESLNDPAAHMRARKALAPALAPA
ncbi:MAG: FAD-dependent oxidoreductase [Hydrogenophaga sp.]|jgi:3-phenylpropionate/trans-cinnamate dioxygenase ferredoxin reductase subunit|uniref:NAD(P)/FAD-dependent oxidoreductase n=1 Tax=Hydrogenophaga sp. TaxID=1904254 RepID=UPI001DF387A8|nr:FAD-dependent oxidoreductase [Hydrogenophaga sp.]MBW0170972.1 FAD-dependent oxidoreductase [Hydrogenophaga sp.]MBW0185047.1 FAD-dependent oxidoreductase [Hydrogenophaga sp.]